MLCVILRVLLDLNWFCCYTKQHWMTDVGQEMGEIIIFMAMCMSSGLIASTTTFHEVDWHGVIQSFVMCAIASMESNLKGTRELIPIKLRVLSYVVG